MGTSGTIGQTIIDTDRLLDHAMFRVGLTAADKTPEFADLIMESLYMLLLHLMNKGLNLWAIDKQILGLKTNQSGYVLSPGTIDVLDVMFATTTQIAATLTTGANVVTAALTTPTTVIRVGFRVSAGVTAAFTLSYSSDNITYTIVTNIVSQTLKAGQWVWTDVDVGTVVGYFRINSTSNFTLQDFYLASASYEVPLTQWSRDMYSQQPNKYQPGDPSTNYYYEKLIDPKLTLWPVPQSDYKQVLYWRQRQLQDVGSLTQQLEIPQRWLEAVIWETAVLIGFEAPNADKDKFEKALAIAPVKTIEAGSNENDGGPVTVGPNISGYTK